jgi:NTE family protein
MPNSRQPTYERDLPTQQAFNEAAAWLLEHDAWVDPAGQHRLNADLVLEGGGVKGIGLAGAILVLAEAGYHFPRVAGTSAGAIAATLVGSIEQAGQPMIELNDDLRQLDFGRFMQQGPLAHVFGDLGLAGAEEAVRLIDHMGLFSGDYLAEWMAPILDKLNVNTFGDLRITDDPEISLPPERQYRVVVHVSDITRGALVHLPWDYNFYGMERDSQRLIDAVRASMSIPFFFEPVRVNANTADVEVPAPGGGTTTEHYEGGSVTWVDGGMLANFPINAFDRIDGKPPRWPTVGIKLSAQPLEFAKTRSSGSTVAEAVRCLHTMLNEWDCYAVTEDTAARTIFVDNVVTADDGHTKVTIKATDFGLSAQEQQELFLNGARAATAFVIAKAQAGGVPRGGRDQAKPTAYT